MDLWAQVNFASDVPKNLDSAEFNFQSFGAVLTFQRSAGGTSILRDQGKGFDWSKYLTINPERMFDLHGRGIALSAASCFDRLEYHGVGNEV